MLRHTEGTDYTVQMLYLAGSTERAPIAAAKAFPACSASERDRKSFGPELRAALADRALKQPFRVKERPSVR